MNWKMHSTHKQNQGGNYSKNARLSGAEVLLWKQREARIWHRNTTQNIFIIKLSTKEPHIKHIFYELDRIQLLEKERGKQTDRKKEVGRKIKEGRTKMKKFNNDSDFIYHFFQKFHFLSMRYKVCICYFFISAMFSQTSQSVTSNLPKAHDSVQIFILFVHVTHQYKPGFIQ